MDSILKTFSTFKDKIVKTPLERLVYDACTDENWGVPNTSLHEISQKTFSPEERGIIMKTVWELLRSPPKEWRRLYKVLNLIDHLLKFGSEACSNEISAEMYKIRSFQDFSYREGIEEKGIGIRDKAKYLAQMLGDQRNLSEEREKAQKLWNKFNGGSGHGQYSGNSDGPKRNQMWEPQRTWDNQRVEKQAALVFKEPERVKEVSIQPTDIFRMPDVKGSNDLWKNENVKVIKPPTGFHPAGLQSKAPSLFVNPPAKTLNHSQSVASNHFDLLFDEPPAKAAPVFDPFAEPIKSTLPPKQLPGPTLQKFNSASLDADWLNQGVSSISFDPVKNTSQGVSSVMFEPTKTTADSLNSLNFELGPKVAQVPKVNTLPNDLFLDLGKTSGTTNAPQFNLPNDLFNPSSGVSRQNNNPPVTNTPKLSVNIGGTNGTSMAQMKAAGNSGFTNFMSAPVQKAPESLESKLFDLDNLGMGQPKPKELTKNRW